MHKASCRQILGTKIVYPKSRKDTWTKQISSHFVLAGLNLYLQCHVQVSYLHCDLCRKQTGEKQKVEIELRLSLAKIPTLVVMVYVPRKDFYRPADQVNQTCTCGYCCCHRNKKTLFLLVVAVSFTLTVIFYLCPSDNCPIKFKRTQMVSLQELMAKASQEDDHWLSTFNSHFLQNVARNYSFKERKFDTSKNDVLIFLHIQKTGGSTMERNLVNMIMEIKCNCEKTPKLHCNCSRTNNRFNDPWLLCRYTEFDKNLGSWPCGLHPDLTELKTCAPHILKKYHGQNPFRSLLFMTILRDPVSRYASEYLHVHRGATWTASQHICKGRRPTEQELPKCYKGKYWKGVQLQDFMKCPFNLGNNRQTRMLADLTKVHCYDTTAMEQTRRDKLMLLSAMHNLVQMPYFALLEYPAQNQYIFEKTFDLHMENPPEILESGYANENLKKISDKELEQIKKTNALDMKLYEFAKIIYFKRLKYLHSKFGGRLKEVLTVAHKVPKYNLQNNLRKGNQTKESKKRRKKKNKKNKKKMAQ